MVDITLAYTVIFGLRAWERGQLRRPDMSEMTSSQRHLLKLGQQYCQQNANVGSTEWLLSGLCLSPHLEIYIGLKINMSCWTWTWKMSKKRINIYHIMSVYCSGPWKTILYVSPPPPRVILRTLKIGPAAPLETEIILIILKIIIPPSRHRGTKTIQYLLIHLLILFLS